ncbi:CDP-diacylglycerol--glycerol-3-phosphate 3-phosphatidyltransferase [Candidatus Legionella polyplacis]|uniref:CDP-diacylglycerol--glycerol-3-phosphate 3-phosphatidyltransferase n=2 Tax=Candidatus Legionella polyplacis TaxID=2005262 RepID=A0ABZ2H0X1_9GAMM
MNMFINVPNFLTFIRIILIPVFVLIFYLPFFWSNKLAAIIFAFASFTDCLDGYLARKLRQISMFGAFLDPVADKLLVVCSLLLLVGSKCINNITIPAFIIIGREIIISSLREWMAKVGNRTSIAVRYIGKIKTLMQMIALFLLIFFNSFHSLYFFIGLILLYISVILTLWSMIIYIIIVRTQLTYYND